MNTRNPSPRPMPNHNTWPAFVLPWDDGAPGPTNMSHLLHKPAGSKGFIRIADGHLATGDGERWRIWGQNFCFNSALPPADMAPAIARRVARFGINCIRLHHMDRRWPRGVIIREDRAAHTRALDPEALERLDYFVACCKEHGVYIDLNLNVSRQFTAADGVAQAEWIGYGKALTYFDPVLIELQKEYAEQILSHTNPHTGVRYAEEPVIAIVEMINENSLLESWLKGRLQGAQTASAATWSDIPPAYAERLNRLWNAWLSDRYADRQALADAWDGNLGDDEDPAAGRVRRLRPGDFPAASKGRFADEATFYAGLERGFFEDMARFLREDLGVKQVIVGTSDHNHSINGQLHVKSNAVLGIIDGHVYWQHPRFPNRAWSRSEWLLTNTPMVDAPDHSAPAQLSRSPVQGMPYILSELNEPFPNDYAAEFIPIIAAYGRLQDWDGIFMFAYGGGSDASRKTPFLSSYFDMCHDPVKMAQTAAGALVFLRGDVQTARRTVAQCLTNAHVIESLRHHPPDDHHPYGIPYLPGRLALVHRTVIGDFEADAVSPAEGEISLPERIVISDTGELTWQDAADDGRVLADAPRYQAVIGRPGRLSTSNMTVDLETPFAAVQLVSLDAGPVAHAERMLLVTAARVANTGMAWQDDTRRSLGEQWGEAPTRIEPVTATLSLNGLTSATAVTLVPLDGAGQPTLGEMPFQPEGHTWRIRLTGKPGTVWYVVEVIR